MHCNNSATFRMKSRYTVITGISDYNYQERLKSELGKLYETLNLKT